MLFQLYLVLFGVTFLFYSYENLTSIFSVANSGIGTKGLNYREKRAKRFSFYLLAVIFIILSLYCGLRTSFNDTYAYINGFNRLSTSFSDVNWNLSHNPGFAVLQKIIKIIFNDSQMLLLLSSLFVNFSYMRFIVKYSINTYISGFVYIASGIYLFNFAAIKQCIAIAILLFSVDFLLNKKYFKFVLLVALATTIHLFAVIFIVAPLFTDKLFNRPTVVVLLFSLSIGALFNSFVELILSVLGSFTDEYTEELLEGSGIGIFRLLVSAVAPVCLYLDRVQVENQKSPILNLASNFTIVSFAINIMSTFGNPNFFGRMTYYFSPFTLITYAYIIEHSFGSRWKKLIPWVFIGMYSVYYYNLFVKYAGNGWDIDLFNHVSLYDVIFN